MEDKHILKGINFIDGTKEDFSEETLQYDAVNFVRLDETGDKGYIQAFGKKYGNIENVDCGTF